MLSTLYATVRCLGEGELSIGEYLEDKANVNIHLVSLSLRRIIVLV